MKTCVFTPAHETGILVAHIIPYAGSHDTRLGRESAWPLAPSGSHVFSGRCGSRGFFAPWPVERRFCFVGIRGHLKNSTLPISCSDNNIRLFLAILRTLLAFGGRLLSTGMAID